MEDLIAMLIVLNATFVSQSSGDSLDSSRRFSYYSDRTVQRRVNLKMNLRLMTASPVHLHSSIALVHTANPKWFICPHRLLCKCQSIIYLEAHDRIRMSSMVRVM